MKSWLRLQKTVVPYIGTWIETTEGMSTEQILDVVPYIGTWIETKMEYAKAAIAGVVPYIGTWIETITC